MRSFLDNLWPAVASALLIKLGVLIGWFLFSPSGEVQDAPVEPVPVVSTETHPTMIEKLIVRLREEEGFRAFPYHDTRDVLTIGYGTNLDQGISEKEAAYLLSERLLITKDALGRAWPPYYGMPESVRMGLLDMAYQLGVHGVLGFTDMLSALDREDWPAAIAAARDSHWDEETPARVERVVSLFHP